MLDVFVSYTCNQYIFFSLVAFYFNKTSNTHNEKQKCWISQIKINQYIYYDVIKNYLIYSIQYINKKRRISHRGDNSSLLG